MNTSILLACDLDGTVLPNDPAIPLAPYVMDQFTRLIESPNVFLAYLSGRSLDRALIGIRSYDAPLPAWYVGDVGTAIYRKVNEEFVEDSEWAKTFSSDWGAVRAVDITTALSDISELRAQEPERQREFKVSYYFEPEKEALTIAKVRECVAKLKIECAVLTLIEPSTNTGYLDIIPKNATKLQALEYIRSVLRIDHDDVLYAGDAGNDLGPLTSGYKSVVVKNASDVFKERVRTIATEKNILDSIYFAHSDLGDYAGGILEAVSHFNLASRPI